MRGTLYLVNRAHPLAEEPEAEALVPVDGGHSRIMLHQRARVMLEQLLTVDRALWREEVAGIREFYGKFGDKLPAALSRQLDELERKLS